MSSWKEFITIYVNEWRRSITTLTSGELQALKSTVQYQMYARKTQVYVVTFEESPKVIWFVTWDESRQDMEVSVHPTIEANRLTFLEKMTTQNPTLFQQFSKSLEHLNGWNVNLLKITSVADDNVCIQFIDNLISKDPINMAKNDFKDTFNRAIKVSERNIIEKKTEEIKSEAEKLLERDTREKILEAAEKIQASIKEINRIETHEQKIAAIEGEIAGVRKLIGSSIEYQDWKVLVDEVSRIKNTPNVSKEAFESEIKRIDQKIDGLKEIKFWSKRAIIDILLAAFAATSTIIAALLAAGVIHF
jgi:hypothetical protein